MPKSKQPPDGGGRRLLSRWPRDTGKGAARRLTSGDWTVPVSLPPGPPSSPLSWSPNDKQLAVVRVATPYTGDSDKSAIQLLDVDTGALRA